MKTMSAGTKQTVTEDINASLEPVRDEKTLCIVCKTFTQLVVNADFLVLPFSGETATQKMEEWRECMPDADDFRSVVEGIPQAERFLCCSCVEFMKQIDECEDKLSVKLQQLWEFLKKPAKRTASAGRREAPASMDCSTPVKARTVVVAMRAASGAEDDRRHEDSAMSNCKPSQSPSPAVFVEQEQAPGTPPATPPDIATGSKDSRKSPKPVRRQVGRRKRIAKKSKPAELPGPSSASNAQTPKQEPTKEPPAETRSVEPFMDLGDSHPPTPGTSPITVEHFRDDDFSVRSPTASPSQLLLGRELQTPSSETLSEFGSEMFDSFPPSRSVSRSPIHQRQRGMGDGEQAVAGPSPSPNAVMVSARQQKRDLDGIYVNRSPPQQQPQQVGADSLGEQNGVADIQQQPMNFDEDMTMISQPAPQQETPETVGAADAPPASAQQEEAEDNETLESLLREIFGDDDDIPSVASRLAAERAAQGGGPPPGPSQQP